MTLDDWLAAADRDPDPASVLLIAADDLEEQGLSVEAATLRQELPAMLGFPGLVGEVWLINTVTRYFIGRIIEKGAGYIVLDHAAWVHWTGRLSILLDVLRAKKPNWQDARFGTRRPRVEPSPAGLRKVVALHAVVDADGPFPEAALPGGPVE